MKDVIKLNLWQILACVTDVKSLKFGPIWNDLPVLQFKGESKFQKKNNRLNLQSNHDELSWEVPSEKCNVQIKHNTLRPKRKKALENAKFSKYVNRVLMAYSNTLKCLQNSRVIILLVAYDQECPLFTMVLKLTSR